MPAPSHTPHFSEHTLDHLHDGLRCGLKTVQIVAGAMLDGARSHGIEHGEWLHRLADGTAVPPPSLDRSVAIYTTALRDLTAVHARWLDSAGLQWQRLQALQVELAAWLPRGAEFALRATDAIGDLMQRSLGGPADASHDGARAPEDTETPTAQSDGPAQSDDPAAPVGRSPRRRAA